MYQNPRTLNLDANAAETPEEKLAFHVIESPIQILSPTIKILHIKLEDSSIVKVRIVFIVSHATAVIKNMLVRPHKVLTTD